jgi:hypothetical protein
MRYRWFRLWRFTWYHSCKRMSSTGMLRHVVLVRTDIGENVSPPSSVTKISKLGTTFAVTSNRSTLRNKIARQFLSPWWWRRYVPPKRPFFKKPQGEISQMTAFFLVTAVKTSNLSYFTLLYFTLLYFTSRSSRELCATRLNVEWVKRELAIIFIELDPTRRT